MNSNEQINPMHIATYQTMMMIKMAMATPFFMVMHTHTHTTGKKKKTARNPQLPVSIWRLALEFVLSLTRPEVRLLSFSFSVNVNF